MATRLLLAIAVLTAAGRAAASDDFFETRIRPILAEHCFKCHGPKQQKGGVRLDARAYMRNSRDGSGPLVRPGKPEASPLIKAVRHEGDYAMPPGKKLNDQAIEALTKWVKDGAKWPTAASRQPADLHWAFKLVQPPSPPSVKAKRWPVSDLDRFVLARLEAKNLAPSPQADKRTLLRRVTFDLTGLPPAPSDLDAFLKDESSEAYSKAVDRLLAHPAFGERWGRHWLDVARYSDTKSFLQDAYTFAFTYRDWVVKAFNDDLAYDQFLLKQIAADHLTRTEGHPDLAALGFLTLGRKFEDNEPDIIDDRIDVIFRGTQALTVSCSRCHDHKYDPIPIKDYYSLYGVFQGATEREVPIIATPADRAKYVTYAAELRARTRSLNKFEEAERKKLFGLHTTRAAEYLTAAHKGGGKPKEEGGPREDGLNQTIVDRYEVFLASTKEDHHPILAPWHAFAALKPGKFADTGKKLARRFSRNDDAEKPLNPLVARMFAGKPPANLDDVARRYGKLFGAIAQKWQRALDDADARDIDRPARLLDEDEDELRKLFSDGGSGPLGDGDLDGQLPEEKQQIRSRLQSAVEEWKVGPDAPPMARVLDDPEEAQAARVFVRGKSDQPGVEVPKRFLAVLSGHERPPFGEGTGRLELAQAIASKDNPLTARVWANRVWGHLVGRPLVGTTSDFGVRCEPPTHPELLDWLASQLVEKGWSTKQLIRLIVLSKTYQQSSADRPDAEAADPANALLARMNRKRLEWEPLRDALLSAAGRLDGAVGGRPVDPNENPLTERRTLYLTVDRGNLPGMFRAFDFANPDMTSSGRHETTVPQQALFLLNSPFALEQARALARRAESADKSDAAFLNSVYRFALGRAPRPKEEAAASQFLSAAKTVKSIGPSPAPVAWKYGVGKWDAARQQVTSFQPFAHFQDEHWRSEATEIVDAKMTGLSARGGHAATGKGQVVVRRWVAPSAGVAFVEGALKHELDDEDRPKHADGVRGYVVAGGKRVVAVDAFEKEIPTRAGPVHLKAGDTIDFAVDARANVDGDSFTWKVFVTFRPAEKAGAEVGYDSAEDFRGPPSPPSPRLSPRAKLAQVLLMTNEFLYID